jgi:hypothetical protein
MLSVRSSMFGAFWRVLDAMVPDGEVVELSDVAAVTVTES